MSRSNYTDDLDSWALIRWRGAVSAAIRGKRGQKLLKEMLDALDTLPEKKLITEALVKEGQCCALGALGLKQGIDLADLDPYDYRAVAKTFDSARALIQEIVYENDEGGLRRETPEQRWSRMRTWVAENIIEITL